MLHFVKIVALVQGVYLESLSKILPIDLFLENKIPKKDYVPGGRKRHIL